MLFIMHTLAESVTNAHIVSSDIDAKLMSDVEC